MAKENILKKVFGLDRLDSAMENANLSGRLLRSSIWHGGGIAKRAAEELPIGDALTELRRAERVTLIRIGAPLGMIASGIAWLLLH